MQVLDHLKAQYGQCYTPKHYTCLPFSTRTMQDNPYLFYPCYHESSGSHHSEGASNNPAASTVITSTSAHPYQWSSTVFPVIGNDDSSLTAFSDAAENFHCVAHASFHQTACTLPVPLTSRPSHYSDAHLRPWLSEIEKYVPPTGWNASNVAGMQFNRSQVPSGTTDPNVLKRGRTWSCRGDNNHAVGAPAQPTFLRETGYPSYQIPTWLSMPAFPEVGASSFSASQVQTTSFDGVSSWTAQSVLGQVPSLSRHRRHTRRAHARPERVICDKCQKQMHRQSLRRHVREVHDRIRRHAKSGFATEP